METSSSPLSLAQAPAFSIEPWLLAAFRAERAPARSRRVRKHANPLVEPLRLAGVSCGYWVAFSATLLAWLIR